MKRSKAEKLLARIRGTVTDRGRPWPGVEVSVRGRTFRVRTDQAGRYDLPYFPYDWESNEIVVRFWAPCSLLKTREIAAKEVLVERGRSVTVDVDSDASFFAEPLFMTIEGEFLGSFSWGFERCCFEPDEGTVPQPQGNVPEIRDLWAEPVYGALFGRFKADREYRVRWKGRIEGPGSYGHLGSSSYLMVVDQVLESRVQFPWRTD
jgi:hypothetical protein